MEKRNLIILAVALLFLVIGATTIVIVSHNKKEAQRIEEKKEQKKQEEEKKKEEKNLPKLPDLTGLTVEEAAAKLNAANISSNYTIKREDSDLRKDVIVRTEPEAGTDVEGTIDLVFYLSKGNTKVVIDDYEGKSYKEVKAYLEARDIKVRFEMREPNYERDNVPDDMIIGQSVEAGASLKAGDIIVLYIPKGSVKYPDFTDGNYTLKDVQAFCEEYGIKLDVLMDEVTEYEDGKVFYQDGCLPGEAVETGCEMSIKVAKH